MRTVTLSALIVFLATKVYAQEAKVFTHADTLRGTVGPERSWWNVLRYDLWIKPDYLTKTTVGTNRITYQVLSQPQRVMQLDLQQPLVIDSIMLGGKTKLQFEREGNAWHVPVPKQPIGSTQVIDVHFSGTPHEAIRAPWDGGWSFVKDSLGRPWMTVTCQGLGASIWYPCKDHQSDEPDRGASLSMTVPDSLTAIGNGRLQSKQQNHDGTTTWTYAVTNPISNYCLIPYIGKYVNFKEVYDGAAGKLDLNYWVLDYNLDKARSYMPDQVHKMLQSFEYWFGPYPFYKDGYQLIETSHTGMEHQSAVSYGNWYQFGYRKRDGSGTGWGMKFDFIIIHESGHEWFGNNITTKDLADMWVHEGFTNYSETLFVDRIFGTDAANDYNFGIRRGIRNDRPIIPAYNVNAQGSGDMYPKAGNMLHSIRHSIDDDSLFRDILRGLNRIYHNKTVTSREIEFYISSRSGFDYRKVFDQYLRNTGVPVLEFYFNDDKSVFSCRYTNCIKGFNLPLKLHSNGTTVTLQPTTEWKKFAINSQQVGMLDADGIRKMYYIDTKPVTP